MDRHGSHVETGERFWIMSGPGKFGNLLVKNLETGDIRKVPQHLVKED